MGSMRRLAASLAAVALVVSGAVSATAAPKGPGPSTPSSVVVEVQTYNMYFGANLTPLFTPDANIVEAATAI